MKKIFTLFLALVASVGTMLASVAIDGIAYNLNETDSTAEVTSGGSYSGNIVIPESITYEATPYRVTSIGERAFSECSDLTSITIPHSVEAIGSKAFCGCTGLTSVTIPNSVTTIGEGIFEECTGLTHPVYNAEYFICLPTHFEGTYAVPDGIKHIATGAFYKCNKLTAVTIPEGVLSIGEHAFILCTKLANMSLPNSLTTIKQGAFYYCNSLTSLYIPENVSSISHDAFFVHITYGDDEKARLPFIKTNFTRIDVDPANAYFASKDGVLYNKDMTKLLAYPAGKEGKFIVPDGVQEIGPFVFYGNVSLTEIEFPKSLTTIQEWAFGYCTSLKSLTLPSSLKEIGACAIAALIYLPSVTCEAVNPPKILQPEISGESGLGLGSMLDENFNPIARQILYVPANSVEAYQAAEGWNKISDIRPISATVADITEPQVEPMSNSVIIEWPKNENAETYTIVIKKGNDTICTLTFDAQGQLVTISFATPSRNDKVRNAQQTLQTATGWQYTISGLEPNTEYTYIVTAKNGENVVYEQSVPFKTQDAVEGVDMINQSPITNKVIKNGTLLIERNGRTYTATGAEVK